ncbi:MAG: hypothetical protein DMG32_08310 [Acidobacteria bacterium]|nr:MAG: hypothetical protein DMG32_08310 [Acidobacteriota bacterium]
MGARPVHVKAFGVFLLAFCAAAPLAWGRQNQSAPPDEPAASSQPAQQQDQQGSDATSGPPAQQEAQRAAAQSTPAVPATLTLPAGTMIPVRISLWLSSDRNHAGETFSAVLDQPLVVHGWVVARRGQTVIGRVDVAQKASEGKGVSRLGLEITELTLVDGEQLPVSTQMQQAAPSPAPPGSAERNVATVGTTAVLGTIVGAAIGGGQGAAIGAGLGATAGVAAVLYTRGRPTVVAPETLLSFRLAAPLAISTEKGQVAFQPVTQSDYKDQDAYANAPRRRGHGPGFSPPYYYYGYCGPWGWGCYPGPYFGPYIGWGGGVWGFGPRFGGFGRFRR